MTAWNTTWTITQDLNSGSMAITQTSLTAGVATYSYAVTQGQNPVTGQLVTVTGTLNADGTLNVVNTAIASVTGTNIGTFTINGFQAAVNYAATAEEGQAVTAGSQFTFEPGVGTLGTGTSPIYGNGTGGDVVVNASGQFMAPGTKQGCYGFITRNGYYTAPSPPSTFTIPDNTTGLLASQVGIGPPNVVGRYFIFTESGQEGTPGGNFFLIPENVTYIVENVSYTATQTLLNDNVSTTATFFFTDYVLLNAEAADVQGNNLFNLIELGNPGWMVSYASRNFYGRCQNKIQNFLNLSFDGGYLLGQPFPLGWSQPDIYGSLLVSPVFGNSYYIQNSTLGTISFAGLISQPAFQDYYQIPIINANTSYSVRVTARCPSGLPTGNLLVLLVSQGVIYGQFVLPFASMTSNMETYTGTLLVNQFSTVPNTLALEVCASGIGAGADVEIDRLEVFNTAIPVLPFIYASYIQDPEAIDGDNEIYVGSENVQPVYGARVLYDTLYFMKQGSLYSTQASPNLEPGDWTVNEVSQEGGGACGILAYDSGEQWIVTASRPGLYAFVGGQPGKISQEIFPIWDSLNWDAGNCIWVKVDEIKRRILVGVPMPTPNFWLPKAPVNAAPTTPNVILELNYQGLDSGEALKTQPQMHTTMFGTLNAVDMRRKWSIWQIPSPYAAFVLRSPSANQTDLQLYICNGKQNSKIYLLDPSNITDDGSPIPFLYTTAGFGGPGHEEKYPLLGSFIKLWKYMVHQTTGSGTMNVTLYPNILLGPDETYPLGQPQPWTVPGGYTLTSPAVNYRQATANFQAYQTFVEFAASTTVASSVRISKVILIGCRNIWNAITGIK